MALYKINSDEGTQMLFKKIQRDLNKLISKVDSGFSLRKEAPTRRYLGLGGNRYDLAAFITTRFKFCELYNALNGTVLKISALR